jgi:hypothetical protein
MLFILVRFLFDSCSILVRFLFDSCSISFIALFLLYSCSILQDEFYEMAHGRDMRLPFVLDDDHIIQMFRKAAHLSDPADVIDTNSFIQILLHDKEIGEGKKNAAAAAAAADVFLLLFFVFLIVILLTLFTLFTPVLLPFASVVKSTTTQRRGPHARSGVQHGH